MAVRTHGPRHDRAAARRNRHRRRPDRQPSSRRGRDHRPGARISTNASPSSSRGRRRCCERRMRRSWWQMRRRWRVPQPTTPVFLPSSARTSRGTGSIASTVSSPASPSSSRPSATATPAHPVRGECRSTAASRRSGTSWTSLSWRGAAVPGATGVLYGSGSGCRRSGRSRWSPSAATDCASFRSTVSTACATGASSFRRPAR